MKGYLVLRGSNPLIERTLTLHAGGGAICLEQAGKWELIPDPQHFKLS